MNKIILIGGSPTAGKTHAAKALAKERNLPWMSTDTVREQMRALVKPAEYPALFRFADETSGTAAEVLTGNTPAQMVAHEKAEGEEVWRGVKALIETDYAWGDFIMEGVAILPHLVAELSVPDKEIKAVFLIDEDEARVRNTIFTRGLWDEAHKYPDAVKELEVAWILAFNAWIKKEAQAYGFPVISVNRTDHLEELKRLTA